MTIIRVKHDKQNPYVMINRHALWDKNLSLEAVGLWARLLSRPNDWQIHVTELAKSCDLCEDTINKIIKELIDNGYAARSQLRGGSQDGKYPNRFAKYEYWIFEEKKTREEISNILSEPTLSAPIPSAPTEQALLNTECLPKNKKEVVCIADAVAPQIDRPLEKIIEKKLMGGQLIKISLEEIFTKAVLEKKDWSASEIRDVWQILKDYEGYIRDPLAFFEGTIKNLRQQKRKEFLNQGKKCQSPKESESYQEQMKRNSCKDSTSGQNMENAPSLQSILDRLTQKPLPIG